MVNRIQSTRSSVSGVRPTGRPPGELYVNWPDNQLGVINAANTAQDLIAVRFFSALTSYVTGDYAVQGGHIYRANTAITPGAFNPTQWDSVPAKPYIDASNMGYVNKFRNPGFDHWQRGMSVNAVSAVYTADGWVLGFTGAAGPLTVSRQALGAPAASAGVPGACGLNVAGAAGITACNLVQRIESYLSAQLTPGQPITVSFWVSSNAALTPQIQIGHPTALDNFAASTIDVGPVNVQPVPPNTWTRVAYTFTLPTGTQQSGLGVWLMLGAIGTASVIVAAADIRSTPGSAIGPNAIPPSPELRSVATELVICQRYFINMLCTANGYGTAGLAITCPENRFPVPMRVNPTLTPSSITYANSSALTLAPLGGQGVNASLTVTATGNAYATFNLLASAEL